MLEAVIEVLPSIQNDQSPDPEQPLLLDCIICYDCGTPLCAMNRYPTRLDYTHVACQIVDSYSFLKTPVGLGHVRVRTLLFIH